MFEDRTNRQQICKNSTYSGIIEGESGNAITPHRALANRMPGSPRALRRNTMQLRELRAAALKGGAP